MAKERYILLDLRMPTAEGSDTLPGVTSVGRLRPRPDGVDLRTTSAHTRCRSAPSRVQRQPVAHKEWPRRRVPHAYVAVTLDAAPAVHGLGDGALVIVTTGLSGGRKTLGPVRPTMADLPTACRHPVVPIPAAVPGVAPRLRRQGAPSAVVVVTGIPVPTTVPRKDVLPGRPATGPCIRRVPALATLTQEGGGRT